MRGASMPASATAACSSSATMCPRDSGFAFTVATTARRLPRNFERYTFVRMTTMPRVGAAVNGCLLLAVAFAATGCGSSPVVVHGQLLMNGQPYHPEPGEQVFVVFIPE